jgi:hypothetical protein
MRKHLFPMDPANFVGRFCAKKMPHMQLFAPADDFLMHNATEGSQQFHPFLIGMECPYALAAVSYVVRRQRSA